MDRYENIRKMLDNIPGCVYSRIEAVDGGKMEQSLECQKLLSLNKELINKNFKSIAFNQKWIYDGTVRTSFPGLNLFGHHGAKGLILSNIKAFENALSLNYDWFCILEDDAMIDLATYNTIITFINSPENKNMDMILLDYRNYGYGGTAGMLYSMNIMGRLLNELHPLSNFSINMEEKHGLATLWDWKLWKYIENTENPKIKYASLPCIKCADFVSTIN
jgi:hypothetical protein